MAKGYHPDKSKTPTRMVNGRPSRTRNTSIKEDIRESIGHAADLSGGMLGKARDAFKRRQHTDHENY